jgi:hypothetical protein
MLTPIDIARKAKEMQEDDVVRHIFTYLEGRYISEWRNAAPGDLQKREAAYAAIRSLEDIKVKLGSLANAPKVEAHNNRNAARR